MSDLSGQWQALIAEPLQFVAQESIAGCFYPPVPISQVQQLLSKPRFAGRLLQLLMCRRGLSPLAALPTPQQQDLTVLGLAPQTFARLPRLCGAVWHGATLRREIRSEVVMQLRQALGAPAYAQVLARRHLAGAADLLREPAALIEAIDRDGLACVNGWLLAQPPALQDWLRLRLPALAEQMQQLPKGADITREMAATLIVEHEEIA
jgi:hypothetical protein